MDNHDSITRRDALRAGIGFAAGFGATGSFANLSAQDSRFPQIPSWNTELKQLAPNVFAYTQATGPGVEIGRAHV